MASNHDVAHAWSHNTGKQQRNGTNSLFYFPSNRTIYSYSQHAPIARFATNKVVLVSSVDYSTTTSRHTSIVRQAIPLDCTVFYVWEVMADNKAEHKKNYKIMRGDTNTLYIKASKARSNKLYYLEQYNAAINEANDYSKLFKLGYRRIKPIPESELKQAKEHISKQVAKKLKKDTEDFFSFKRDDIPVTKFTFIRYNSTQNRFESSQCVHCDTSVGLKLLALAKKARKSKQNIDRQVDNLPYVKTVRALADGTIIAGCHHMRIEALETAYKQYKSANA